MTYFLKLLRQTEIYRTRERVSERGHKPGYYVVVSRDLVANHPDIATVICVPVYGEVLGLWTEVAIGVEEGVSRQSAIHCVMLMVKAKLTGFVARAAVPPAWLPTACAAARYVLLRPQAYRVVGTRRLSSSNQGRKSLPLFTIYLLKCPRRSAP